MKTCPSCSTTNADAHRFCQHCGLALEPISGAGDAFEAATQLMQRPEKPKVAPRHAVQVGSLFADKGRLIIGRAPDCDVCLQHPSISRYHALLMRVSSGIQISDLCSVNGVLVDGRRIPEPLILRDRQRVGIGPFLFTLIGDRIHSLDNSRSLRLEGRNLVRVVRLADGQPKTLLDNVNLVVQPGEFVSLLGPSGSGKSTLMDCLNGRRRATGGSVLANGEDFYRHFDSFRQSLGYVPQRDIVHTQLTTYRALFYTARLRLPTDTDRTELAARVDEVIEEMELGPHRHTLVGNLSGGQIKRVSLGAELIARPCLLYVDEATSGLDAGTEARMMRLFRRLADEGRSLVCITHNVDNVDQCHLVVVLNRGKLMFCAPPGEAPGYFGVRRISDIYDRLQENTPESWEKRFQDSPLYAQYVSGRLGLVASPSSPDIQVANERSNDAPAQNLGGGDAAALPSRKPLLAEQLHEGPTEQKQVRSLIHPVSERWHQFKVLTRRYIDLILRDVHSLRLLALQAPIVALFFLLGFANKPYERRIPAPRRLTEDEQATLRSVKDAVDALGNPANLTPEQKQAIARTVVPTTSGERLTVEELLTKLQLLDKEEMLEHMIENRSPMVPDRLIVNPIYTYLLLGLMVIAVLWFGCNNAAKEIVKEEAIFSRERAVNLHILPYLGSKFVVLSVISALQTALIMLVLYGGLELLQVTAGHDRPPTLYMLDYPAQFLVLVLLSIAGVAAGLLLSACVNTPDRASVLLPYVIIPQLILSGAVIVVRDGALYWAAAILSPAYWAFRAARTGETDLPPDFHFAMSYDDNLWMPCLAIAAQAVVMLGLTAIVLRRRETSG